MQDKELHEFINVRLSGYQAPYQEEHWTKMAEKIKSEPSGSRRWGNYFGLFVLILLLSLVLYQLVIKKSSTELPTPMVKSLEDEKNMMQGAANDSLKYQTRNEILYLEPAEVEEENVVQNIKNIGGQLYESTGILSDTPEYAVGNVPNLALNPYFKWVMPELNYQTFLIEYKIRQDIQSKKIWEDSTTYRVFERNLGKWKNVVIVCDWTSSMFKYGTQVVSWLSSHGDVSNIKGFVFFNDCDSTGQALPDSGLPGQMFSVKATQSDQVLLAMIAAVRKGRANEDLEENDAEAMKYAYEHFPEAEEIVLIADNISPVRNMKMVKAIKKPVKIIVCGSTLDPKMAIQPDYFTIAQKTGGSIHTIEDDLVSLNDIKDGHWIKVGDTYFRYKNKAFRPTSKKRRPKRAYKKTTGRK